MAQDRSRVRIGAFCRRLAFAALAGSLVTVLFHGIAGAAPLSVAECRELKASQAMLDQAGVASHIANGPDWAQANLSAEQIARIRDYLALEERILFHCPSGFQNAVLAAIKQPSTTTGVIPPLPEQGVRPKRALADAIRDVIRNDERRTSDVALPARGERPRRTLNLATGSPDLERPSTTVVPLPVRNRLPRTSTARRPSSVAVRGTVIRKPAQRGAATAPRSATGTSAASANAANGAASTTAPADPPEANELQNWRRSVFAND